MEQGDRQRRAQHCQVTDWIVLHLFCKVPNLVGIQVANRIYLKYNQKRVCVFEYHTQANHTVYWITEGDEGARGCDQRLLPESFL